MKRLLAIAFLLAVFALSGTSRAASQGVASLSAATCGDDICSSGENCSNCIWDCGVCDEEGSGGGVITPPAARTVSIWDGGTGHYDCPLSYLSHTASGGFNTSVRFRIINPFTSPTGAFRLVLSSTFNWFVPKNLTYALAPDGYASDGSPYWDIPPLGPNESTEVSFTVKGSVGLINMIGVEAKPLDRWPEECADFVPYSGMGLAQNISKYLNGLNQSQGVTIYYYSNGMVLAHLDKNDSFAVFSLNNTNVSPVAERGAIAALVSAYAAAASPPSPVDTSKPFEVINYSKALKAGAEKSCMAITGMEKYPCVDRTTCRYACASVPACWYVGQVGWPFIDTLLDYKTSVENTNAALERAINSSFAFSQAPSYEAAATALSDMEALNRNETAVIYQPIFTEYNFCTPTEYAMPQMIDARRQLLDYIGNNCIQTEKNLMIDQSAAMAPLLKLAEEAAAARAAAEAIANITNASICGNASINASANATLNASANASMCGNASANTTLNGTAALNVTANVTQNATNNATTDINASIGNGTAWGQNASKTNATNATALQQAVEKAKAYCPVPIAALSGFLALAIISQSRRRRKGKKREGQAWN